MIVHLKGLTISGVEGYKRLKNKFKKSEVVIQSNVLSKL